MAASRTLAIANQIAELHRVDQLLEEIGRQYGWPPQAVSELTLAVHEVIGNIIAYAYDDAASHEIAITVDADQHMARVQVQDDGRHFDPLTIPAPPTQGPLQQRAVGGLGMHLVRALTDAQTYERRGTRNLLTLTKTISA